MVIPVPTYLFDNDELRDIIEALYNVMNDAQEECPRALACIATCNAELRKRQVLISLIPDPVGRPVFTRKPRLQLVE